MLNISWTIFTCSLPLTLPFHSLFMTLSGGGGGAWGGAVAAAGSRHVTQSGREVNDELAVTPQAKMEIGRTHLNLLTTHAKTGVSGVSDAR